MAQVVLHLLVLKLNRKDLRYVVLGPSEVSIGGLPSPTPLFLGADLLEGSGIPSANHCRIHARYARKGLATKLTFPADVAIAGVTNVHSGAWFYGLQGVLQLTFEYHSRQLQVDIVSKLGELWKQRSTDPLLPDAVPVALQQLHQQQQFSSFIYSAGDSHCANPDSGIASPSDEGEEPSHDLHIHNNGNPQGLLHRNHCTSPCKDIKPDIVGQEKDLRSSATCATKKEKCSLSELLHNLASQTSSYLHENVNENGVKEKESGETEGVTMPRALLAFLQILQAEVGSSGDFDDNSSDPGFAPLLEVVMDYRDLVFAHTSSAGTSSPSALLSSSSWRIGECYDTLLCLVSEWLGRRLFCFNADIATHMDEFKSRNLNQIHDLPPPQEMVSELFPRCMRLLVGHWIGLYASPSSSNSTPRSTHSDKCATVAVKEEDSSPVPVVDNLNPTILPTSSGGGRKTKSPGSQSQSRDDHSYSTLPAIAAVSSIDDSCSHRSASSADDGTLPSLSPCAAAAPPPSKKLRMLTASGSGDGCGFKDHNYFSVADNSSAVSASNSVTAVNVQPAPREDHTYVANPVLPTSDIDIAPQPSIVHPPTPSTSGNMRKDHTYVATHTRKNKSAANTPSASAATSPKWDSSATPPPIAGPHLKWLVRPLRCSSNRLRFLEREVDESKYAFIQIILEFVNNALISGVAHVVYTRLLLS